MPSEELLPTILKSPEGVTYRLFFDAEGQRAYVNPPTQPGPGGLPLVSDIYTVSATSPEEATTLLTAWGETQGWEAE